MSAGYRSILARWLGGASAGAFIPPEPPPPSAAHGAGMSRVYAEALRKQAIAIDDEELLLIISEAFGAIE